MILPKTTYAQRVRFYEDVEALLSPGFLTHAVTVAGITLQIRSLSPGDLFMLRSRAHGTSDMEWRVWALATSVWMVDGVCILGEDSTVPLVARTLRYLPDPAVTRLFWVLLGLFSRVQKATDAVVPYSYEQDSRYRWVAFNRKVAYSGVPGADRLGLNRVQQMWVAFNQYEDLKTEMDHNWETAKLVASGNSPKGIRKLDDRDRQRAQEVQERRQKILDTFYYSKFGIVDPKGESQVEGVSHRLSVKSVEDLEDEMRRWVTGDADLHDRVVEDYKTRIRNQFEQEKANRAARQLALQMERDRIEVAAQQEGFRPQPLLALTADQLQRMLHDRGGFGRQGVTYIPAAPNADRLYQKYLAEGAVTTGDLQVSGQNVVDPNADSDVDTRTLNQLIKGRNPAFGGGRE